MRLSGLGWSATAGLGRCLGGAVRALATVLGEVAEQRVHMVERGSIDDVAARTLLRHQAGVRQLLQVERQRVGGDAQSLGHRPWRETGAAPNDQGPEHLEPHRLGQRGERTDDVFFFHYSSLLEEWKR